MQLVFRAVSKALVPSGQPPAPQLDVYEQKIQDRERQLMERLDAAGIKWESPRRGEAVAFMLLRDYHGNEIGVVTIPSDGTPRGSVESCRRLDGILDELYFEHSGTQSFSGATDKSGKVKWVISPNRQHVAEIGTDEARAILGDMEAFKRTQNEV